MKTDRWGFSICALDEMTLEDAQAFREVPLLADLRRVLELDAYAFRVLPRGRAARWDRALLLNLAFWGTDAGGDIMVSRRIPADVVAHAAWHHLAARAVARGNAAPSAEALFFGEAIASAFDLFLVGRLLGTASPSTFLQTQVPALAEVAQAAGVSASGFERLLRGIADDPEGAFEALRQLLFDVSVALLHADGAGPAHAVLKRSDGHRFAPLLHHYALSTWVLYARAYGRSPARRDARVRAVDAELREHAAPLAWLRQQWVTPALEQRRTAKHR